MLQGCAGKLKAGRIARIFRFLARGGFALDGKNELALHAARLPAGAHAAQRTVDHRVVRKAGARVVRGRHGPLHVPDVFAGAVQRAGMEHFRNAVRRLHEREHKIKARQQVRDGFGGSDAVEVVKGCGIGDGNGLPVAQRDGADAVLQGQALHHRQRHRPVNVPVQLRLGKGLKI